MKRNEKVSLVSKISDAIANVDYVYVCNREAMTVAELNRISLDAKFNNVTVKSIKNSLAKIALNNSDADDWLKSSSVFIYGQGDPIVAASLISKYTKMYVDRFAVKGGLLNGVQCDAKSVKRIAAFGDINGLRASMLSLMKSPLAKLPRAFKLIAEKKEKGEI